MNNSVIMKILPGHDAPRGYLQEGLKNCSTAFGITVQDKDGNNPILENSAEAKTLGIDELAKTLSGCKDVPTYVWLTNATQDFDPVDDLQPFVFQMKADGQEKPEDILSVFIEGDFPNYSIPGKGHTDEYNLWEKFIFPTLLDQFDLANSDPEDFYNRLRSSTFEQAIMNTVGHRAAIVFVPLEGEPIVMGRNDLGGAFDWGTTSNRFKWGDPSLLDKAAEVAVSAVKKSGGRLSRLMGTAAAPDVPKPDTPEKPEIKEDGNGIHHVSPSDTDVWKRWPGTSAKTHTMTVVPKKLQGNARNRWIRLFTDNPNGDLPKDKDKDGFMIPVKNPLTGFAQEDLATNDEVRILASKVKHFQTSGIVSNDAVKEASNTTVEHTAAPPKDRPASDFLPELSADTKKGTVDLVVDWATRNKGPTKLDIQRIESKWPKFSLTAGIKFEDMLGWSIADKKALAKKYPDAMALAFTELQLHILESGVGLTVKEPGKPAEKTQVEVPPTQPGTTQTGKRSRLAQLSGKAA